MYNTCIFKECGAPVHCKKLCLAHYQQSRTGRDLKPIRRRKPIQDGECSFEGCNIVAKAKGLCQSHRLQMRKGLNLTPLRTVAQWGVSPSGYLARGATVNGRRTTILQHREVMKEILGRDLLPGENVHHKNGVKTDNRPENLELWVSSQPSGQRPADLISWAREILARYDTHDLMETP